MAMILEILLNIEKFDISNTYDMFTGSILVGFHLYLPSLKVAPPGRTESNLTVTLSPSESKVVTVRL